MKNNKNIKEKTSQEDFKIEIEKIKIQSNKKLK